MSHCSPAPCTVDPGFLEAVECEVSRWASVPLPRVPWPSFKIMLGGDEYYKRIFKMIDSAQTHVFVVSYTFDSSVVSMHIFEGLMRALRRGVRVYLFLENLIELPRAERLAEFKRAGGVVIQRSRKKSFQSMLNKTFFQRDHQKLFVTDHQFVLGSANISEYYGDKRFGKPFFYDLNFYGRNCLSADIAHFLESYVVPAKLAPNSKYTRLRSDLADLAARFPALPLTYQTVKFFSCEVPYNMSLQRKILELIGQARSSIRVVSAYYYPIKAVEDAIIAARARGVSVELVTSSKRDIPAYKHFVNGVLFNNLLRSGVKVYQFRDRYLHAKAIGIDGRVVHLGSFNLDRWSWYNNVETVIHLENSWAESREFDHIFEALRAKSEAIEPRRGYERASKLVRNLFWDNFFLRTCDRLMNRAFFAFHTEMENSLFGKMHKFLSWDPEVAEPGERLRRADALVGRVPLGEVGKAAREGGGQSSQGRGADQINSPVI